MTVKQVAEKVYGPIPDGATLHIGRVYVCDGETFGLSHCVPSLPIHENIFTVYDNPMPTEWTETAADDVIGPDISDRPAASFVGFFGKEFDDAVVQDSSTYTQES